MSGVTVSTIPTPAGSSGTIDAMMPTVYASSSTSSPTCVPVACSVQYRHRPCATQAATHVPRRMRRSTPAAGDAHGVGVPLGAAGPPDRGGGALPPVADAQQQQGDHLGAAAAGRQPAGDSASSPRVADAPTTAGAWYGTGTCDSASATTTSRAARARRPRTLNHCVKPNSSTMRLRSTRRRRSAAPAMAKPSSGAAGSTEPEAEQDESGAHRCGPAGRRGRRGRPNGRAGRGTRRPPRRTASAERQPADVHVPDGVPGAAEATEQRGHGDDDAGGDGERDEEAQQAPAAGPQRHRLVGGRPAVAWSDAADGRGRSRPVPSCHRHRRYPWSGRRQPFTRDGGQPAWAFARARATVAPCLPSRPPPDPSTAPRSGAC